MIAYASEAVGLAQSYMAQLNGIIIFPLIVLLSALAVVIFLFGAFQYVAGSNNEQAREKGKKHILWGLIGLLVMLSAWAILTLVLSTFNITMPKKIGVDAPSRFAPATSPLPAVKPDGGAPTPPVPVPIPKPEITALDEMLPGATIARDADVGVVLTAAPGEEVVLPRGNGRVFVDTVTDGSEVVRVVYDQDVFDRHTMINITGMEELSVTHREDILTGAVLGKVPASGEITFSVTTGGARGDTRAFLKE